MNLKLDLFGNEIMFGRLMPESRETVTGACSVSVRTGTGSELKLRDVIYIMGCKREKHVVKMDERLKLVVVLVDTV